jgi:hypothetical protein
MGIEYRIQTNHFARSDLARKLRDRGLIVRDIGGGVAVWESNDQGMPSVEVQPTGDDQTLVIHGGSPSFAERVVGVILMQLAGVNDHLVLSEL